MCSSSPLVQDSELSDASPGRGGVQHLADASEPREEPQHGRAAARPLAGLPGYRRRRELQLHQRSPRRQLLAARCLRGDAAPAAWHHHRLLEAGVRLRLHLGGDAQPAEPVKLSLGKSTKISFVFKDSMNLSHVTLCGSEMLVRRNRT